MLVTDHWRMTTTPSPDASRNSVERTDGSNTNLLASSKMLFMLNAYRHFTYQDSSKPCDFFEN